MNISLSLFHSVPLYHLVWPLPSPAITHFRSDKQISLYLLFSRASTLDEWKIHLCWREKDSIAVWHRFLKISFRSKRREIKRSLLEEARKMKVLLLLAWYHLIITEVSSSFVCSTLAKSFRFCLDSLRIHHQTPHNNATRSFVYPRKYTSHLICSSSLCQHIICPKN